MYRGKEEMTMTSILNIQASANLENSVTRMLSKATSTHLAADNVVTRNLSDGIKLLDSDWVAANSTPAAERSDAQKNALALSDTLIAEINDADTLVFGLPIYNFGVPAAMKAWIDQIARVGVTFNYSKNGPVGLLENKRAIILVASGGTKLGSDIDFASKYMKHILGFIGITDVTIIAADALMQDAEAKKTEALQLIAELV
jgi:FMN-dependent NADH-azoreductase